MNDLWFRILLFVFSPRCYVLLAALGLGFLSGLVMLSIPGAVVSDAVTRFFFGAPRAGGGPMAGRHRGKLGGALVHSRCFTGAVASSAAGRARRSGRSASPPPSPGPSPWR